MLSQQKNIEGLFIKMQQIIPYETSACKLYSNFLHGVLFNNSMANSILKEALLFSRSVKPNSIESFSIGKGNIIKISTEFGSVGVITDCSYGICPLVGISKEKIVGFNITSFIPSAYKALVKNMIENYKEVEKKLVNAKESEFQFYAKHLSNFIIPIEIKCIELPSSGNNYSIILSAFEPKIKSNSPLILLINSQDYIMDASVNAYQMLKLTAAKISYGIQIKDVLPEYKDESATIIEIGESKIQHMCTTSTKLSKDIREIVLSKIEEPSINYRLKMNEPHNPSKASIFEYNSSLNAFVRSSYNEEYTESNSTSYKYKTIENEKIANENETPTFSNSIYFNYLKMCIYQLAAQANQISDASKRHATMKDIEVYKNTNLFHLTYTIDTFHIEKGIFEQNAFQSQKANSDITLSDDLNDNERIDGESPKCSTRKLKESFVTKLDHIPTQKKYLILVIVLFLYLAVSICGVAIEYNKYSTVIENNIKYLNLIDLSLNGPIHLMKSLYYTRELLLLEE